MSEYAIINYETTASKWHVSYDHGINGRLLLTCDSGALRLSEWLTPDQAETIARALLNAAHETRTAEAVAA